MKSRKRRILHVIGHLEGGGAERQLQILANNTAPDKYRIAILFLHRGTGQYIFDEGIDLLQLPRGSKWNILSLWFRIYKAVMAYQPDILHLWLPEIVTIPAALAGKRLLVPIISSIRRSMGKVNSVKQWIRDRAQYVQHLFACKIVANFNIDSTPFILRKLFSNKQGIVIPNAIRICHDKTPSEPDLPIRAKNSFLIWYTGRIVPRKRVDLLLDSFISLRNEGLDVSLVICGAGKAKMVDKLKQKARKLNMQKYVYFLGHRKDWHDLVYDADVFVLPSTSEGMPNVLFEAMLLGLPCIASDIPTTNHLIEHNEQALLFKPASQKDLTKAIRQLYFSDEKRKQLSRTGQEFVAKFSVEKTVLAYGAIYEELLKEAN